MCYFESSSSGEFIPTLPVNQMSNIIILLKYTVYVCKLNFCYVWRWSFCCMYIWFSPPPFILYLPPITNIFSYWARGISATLETAGSFTSQNWFKFHFQKLTISNRWTSRSYLCRWSIWCESVWTEHGVLHLYMALHTYGSGWLAFQMGDGALEDGPLSNKKHNLNL